MKRPKKIRIPRQYSMVKFLADNISPEYRKNYPFRADRPYIFLGDIPNMPGHCIVADHRSGKLYSGYHTENFEEIPQDEC